MLCLLSSDSGTFRRSRYVAGLDLPFVLIEIERGVQFRLAREQFLYARFVIEGLVGLGLVIGEGFLQARAVLLLLVGEPVERARR